MEQSPRRARRTILSNLFTDPLAPLVADASAVINFNATSHAEEILRLLPHRFVVTWNAVAELERGLAFGHDDFVRFRSLAEVGLAHSSELGERGSAIYESLIDGTTLRTLDDGEAATIGHVAELNGIALLDERKARSVCAKDHPHLEMVSTAELILHPHIEEGLGHEGQADAMFKALRDARMRVPHEHLARVVTLIGEERAGLCPSLPRFARQF